MIYAFIKDGICINVAVFDQEPDHDIFDGICDELVILPDGFGMGDHYIDSQWSRAGSDKTQAELREAAYETMTTKEDGTNLILWEGKAITVDQANKVYLEYSAEGSPKATEIQILIVAAKTYIRSLYPDEEE